MKDMIGKKYAVYFYDTENLFAFSNKRDFRNMLPNPDKNKWLMDFDERYTKNTIIKTLELKNKVHVYHADNDKIAFTCFLPNKKDYKDGKDILIEKGIL
tara:strand:+ start:2120 stop:2416 length:297 start_codon:yes stop_codon:yes gene_type:complete